MLKTLFVAAILVTMGAGLAYAEGCGQGTVWCCKRTYSGGTSCSCTYICS
jgi:hypothetical protein